jgi:hypothetical protein
VEQPV